MSEMRDDRVARARVLRPWMQAMLRTWTPHVVAIEDFGFLRGQHATACLAMAYMTIVDSVDDANVPIIATRAEVWRAQLAGLRTAKTPTKGLKGEALRLAKRANEARTKERENRAHTEAMKRIAGSESIMDMKVVDRVHVLDALGMATWATTSQLVRGLSMRPGTSWVRVMAIDPGLAHCGMVVVDTNCIAHQFVRATHHVTAKGDHL